MAQFQFRLEPVLKQRVAAEDQALRELAKLLRQRMIFHDQLRQMQLTIVQSKHALATSLTGNVNLTKVGQFAGYSGQVTQRAHSIVRRLAVLEKQINTAREELLEATRQRKSMELLRDRQLEEWRRSESRREDEALDEIAVQSYARMLAEQVVR